MALDSRVADTLAMWATELEEHAKAGNARIEALPSNRIIIKPALRKQYDVMGEIAALIRSTLFTGDTFGIRERISEATGAYFEPASPIGWEMGLAHLLSHDLKKYC